MSTMPVTGGSFVRQNVRRRSLSSHCISLSLSCCPSLLLLHLHPLPLRPLQWTFSRLCRQIKTLVGMRATRFRRRPSPYAAAWLQSSCHQPRSRLALTHLCAAIRPAPLRPPASDVEASPRPAAVRVRAPPASSRIATVVQTVHPRPGHGGTSARASCACFQAFCAGLVSVAIPAGVVAIGTILWSSPAIFGPATHGALPCSCC